MREASSSDTDKKRVKNAVLLPARAAIYAPLPRLPRCPTAPPLYKSMT